MLDLSFYEYNQNEHVCRDLFYLLDIATSIML